LRHFQSKCSQCRYNLTIFRKRFIRYLALNHRRNHGPLPIPAEINRQCLRLQACGLSILRPRPRAAYGATRKRPYRTRQDRVRLPGRSCPLTRCKRSRWPRDSRATAACGTQRASRFLPAGPATEPEQAIWATALIGVQSAAMRTDRRAVCLRPAHLAKHRLGFRIRHAEDLSEAQGLGRAGKEEML
jgi:hypothetical protein